MRIMVPIAYIWLNIRYINIFHYNYFKYFIDDLENIAINCNEWKYRKKKKQNFLVSSSTTKYSGGPCI